MWGRTKTKNPLTSVTPMTGCSIPNIYNFYKDIRTAPGHRLFAVRQHGVQQQARWVRLIMPGIILMGRAEVKCALY